MILSEACAKLAWAGEPELHYPNLDGLKVLRRMLRLEFTGTRVSQTRLATTDAFRKTPTSCKLLRVAETGSSDSVTLGLLLASLESLFYQTMALKA